MSTPVRTGPDLCAYSPRSNQWGTQPTVAAIERAAAMFAGPRDGRLAVGDVSRWGGGSFWPHHSHRIGMDADIRPARRDGRQCRKGTAWYRRSYDRPATRAMIRAIRRGAHGMVKQILFNDPALVRAGLTRWWPGHDDHLHVQFCRRHYRIRAYAC